MVARFTYCSTTMKFYVQMHACHFIASANQVIWSSRRICVSRLRRSEE